MHRLVIRSILIIALGVFAYATAPAVATAETSSSDRCGEWIPCGTDCCGDEALEDVFCDFMCPGWIGLICYEDQIYCVNEPE